MVKAKFHALMASFSRPRILFFAIALALLLWRLPYYGKIILDDPYITFRYAENLVQRGALVFNPGEYVLATTTPVYSLLLTPFAALDVALPTVAMLLNLGFELVTLYTLRRLIMEFGLTRRQNEIAFVVVAVLFFTNRAMSIASQSGMETPLFTLLNVVTLLFILRRRYTAAAVFGAVTTLTRPDGIFALVILGAAILIRERRLPLREMVISLVVGAPWAIVATITYGSFIPHSITAKSQIEHIWFSTLNMKLSVLFYEPLRIFGVFMIPPVLWAAYRIMQPERRAKGFVILGFTLLHLLYMLLPSNLGFEWYFAPLYTMFDLLTGIGIALLINQRVIAWVCGLGLSAGIIYSSVGNYLSVATIDQIWRDGMFAATDYLHENAAPPFSIQSTNIGILGYYNMDAAILDPLGLASPQVVPLMATAADLNNLEKASARQFQPDYIVSFGGDGYAGYEQVALFPTSDIAVIVYQREN